MASILEPYSTGQPGMPRKGFNDVDCVVEIIRGLLKTQIVPVFIAQYAYF